MALDRTELNEAADLIRGVLKIVDCGELSADGRAAAATVRRLEGALLALDTINNFHPILPAWCVPIVPRAVRRRTGDRHLEDATGASGGFSWFTGTAR